MTTKVVFAANNGSPGAEPWITDGTRGDTFLLSDVLAGSGTSNPSGFFDLGNGHMLFGASNGSRGRELWIADGTDAGTSMVRDIRTMQQNAAGAPGASYPSGFFQTSPGHALFSANDGSDGGELWVTDGTTGGTSQLADLNPGTFVSGGLTLGNSSSPGNFVATSGGRTLFTATNASTGNELWVTDGTTAGTSLLADINPGTASSTPQNFLRLPNGNLLFSAISGTIGRASLCRVPKLVDAVLPPPPWRLPGHCPEGCLAPKRRRR
jgi:ELWxxDGT repeat protein